MKDAEEWEQHAREALERRGVPGWSVLDIPLERNLNLHQYATGSFALAATDLKAVLSAAEWRQVQDIFESVKVETAFNIRSQAINLKKLCLHLYHYCEQDLKKYITRSTHVFYYHNYSSVDQVKSSLPESCRNWLELYKESSVAYQKLKGVSRVIYDMRFVLKQICCIPRHPKQQVQEKLLEIPKGLLFFISIQEAVKMLKKLHGVEVALGEFVPPIQHDQVEAEEVILKRLRAEFQGFQADFVHKVMIARGITKALRIVAHLKIFVAAYGYVIESAETVVQTLERQLDLGDTNSKDLRVDVVKETNRQVELLSHSLRCAKQMHRVLNKILEQPDNVSFAASDDTVLSRGAVFLEENQFSTVSEAFTFANEVLSKHMPILSQVATICNHIRSESPEDVGAGVLSLCGPHVCAKCEQGFSKHWLVRQVCPNCDMEIRQQLLAAQQELARIPKDRCLMECPYKQRCTRTKVKTLCPHRARCFACDRWSCKECGILVGDAEFVASFVSSSASPPEHIFCDFDRTFATTRKGASPQSSKRKHSVDPTLRSLALNHQNFHILTKNSHEKEINSFLADHGLGKVKVHCIRNLNMEKHEVVSQYCPLDGSSKALLIDDDVTEVCDPCIMKHPHITCILFSRLLR